jgi:hypothetical protein
MRWPGAGGRHMPAGSGPAGRSRRTSRRCAPCRGTPPTTAVHGSTRSQPSAIRSCGPWAGTRAMGVTACSPVQTGARDVASLGGGTGSADHRPSEASPPACTTARVATAPSLPSPTDNRPRGPLPSRTRAMAGMSTGASARGPGRLPARPAGPATPGPTPGPAPGAEPGAGPGGGQTATARLPSDAKRRWRWCSPGARAAAARHRRAASADAGCLRRRSSAPRHSGPPARPTGGRP